jgi:protein required for attachment to host cells
MGPQNWFVVVNRKSAKIFEVSKKPDALNYLKTLRNPLGTAKNRIMSTDRPGMSRGKFASARSPHTFNPERDPHEDVAVAFAKKIASYLKDHKLEKDYLSLTIAAEPHMMGLVKKALSRDRLKVNIKWLRKDLEKMTTAKLESMVFAAK